MLIKGKIIENCKDFLTMFEENSVDVLVKGFSENLSTIVEMKQKTVVLLISLLEGCVKVENFKRMAISFDDFSIVFERMTLAYQNFLKSELKIAKENP